MAYRLGVDVGGTFTDLVLTDDRNGGPLFRAKTSSTPADQSLGVLEGIEKICRLAGISPREIAEIRHGTTVGLNTVLTGSGATVGLITTRGFRYILRIARSRTPGPLAGWITMIPQDPPALVENTIEADERISARGEIIRPLDEEQVRQDLRRLLSRAQIEAITVSLINAYANPVHEQRIREIIRELAPELPVTLSSEVLPEFREYERTLTAALNAYVAPQVGRYLDSLRSRLEARGVPARVSLLRSDGGLMTLEAAKERPVNALVSGPVGGVAGALYICKLAGYRNILTIDVGGTSTDVALCLNGEPDIGRQTTIGQFTVRIPALEVRTVGAGGGSIAHVPLLTKALRVGPQSAGADPGPACYLKGGTEPTVTDANLVLGYLTTTLIGGEITLDLPAAQRAVQRIADALGLDLYRAAEGIYNVVNENMLGALRLVSVQRGYDPRDFALVAFGGAGPLHANAIAKVLGSWPVIIPKGPGLLCALGDLVTDFRNEFARTFIRTFDQTTPAEVVQLLAELGQRARAWLSEQGVPPEQQTVRYQMDVRYHRQGFELPIDVGLDELQREGLTVVGRRFDEAHERLYSFKLETVKEMVNLRAIGQGHSQPPTVQPLASGGVDPSPARSGQQEIYYQGEFHTATLYDRERLLAGNRISGPAIVTEMDSTTLILPGYTAEVDTFGNLVIRPEGNR
ncbi:MAG: hydantoinase/oxoprolinase family protein [Chloroflexi bacterium]|nr:hydantoinase/oxoprolinase family protein [Chloroflexota bacterium]